MPRGAPVFASLTATSAHLAGSSVAILSWTWSVIDTLASARRLGGAKGAALMGAGCGDGVCGGGGGKGEGEGGRSEGAAAAAAAMAAEWTSCSGETLEPTGEAGRMLRAREPILW